MFNLQLKVSTSSPTSKTEKNAFPPDHTFAKHPIRGEVEWKDIEDDAKIEMHDICSIMEEVQPQASSIRLCYCCTSENHPNHVPTSKDLIRWRQQRSWDVLWGQTIGHMRCACCIDAVFDEN